MKGKKMPLLHIENLTKSYKGKKALDAVTLDFTVGVNALLGANGSGKSTMMNIISTALSPTGGAVYYDGREICSLGTEYRKVMSVLFQHQPYFPSVTVNDYMLYNAALKGMSGKDRQAVIDNSLKRLNVLDCKAKKLKELSGGLRQRVFIAQTIMNEPQVIILDEPSAGLDIAGREELKKTIKSLGENAIVIVSTHIVSDIEDISDTVHIIDNGKVIVSRKNEGIEDMSRYYLEVIGKGGAYA